MRKQSLVLARCRRCAMVHLDPLPSGMDETFYDQIGRPYYLSPDKLEGDYASVRFERELKLLRHHVPHGRLLDVGCSTGAFLHQLRARFPRDYVATGIEVSHAAIEFARSRGLEVIEESLLTHDFGDRRFDAIMFWAVLEHLSEPGAFVRRATRLLETGGCCLALVPNVRSLSQRLLGPRYRYVLPQHLNYFSTGTLARLMTSSGLDLVRTGGSHFNPMVLWQDWRTPKEGFVPDAERAALLRRTTRLKQSRALAPARWLLSAVESSLASAGLADNIWVVARQASLSSSHLPASL